MATLPNVEPATGLLAKLLTLFDLRLVAVDVAVAGFVLRDDDVVITLGVGLLFTSDVLATGINLSGKSI